MTKKKSDMTPEQAEKAREAQRRRRAADPDQTRAKARALAADRKARDPEWQARRNEYAKKRREKEETRIRDNALLSARYREDAKIAERKKNYQKQYSASPDRKEVFNKQRRDKRLAATIDRQYEAFMAALGREAAAEAAT